MTLLFSVVIPCYNYGNYLRRAVESVLAQSGNDWELIVINDGSTDTLTDVVGRELAAAEPLRLKYLAQTNRGVSATRNRGIKEAKGEYLIFLDADDEMTDGALEVYREAVIRDRVNIVVCGHTSKQSSGKTKYHSPGVWLDSINSNVCAYLFDKTLILSNGAVAMKKSLFQECRFPESLANSEDVPVFVYALSTGSGIVIDKSVSIVHKHSDSLRHNVSYAKSVGLDLVDEVFCSKRIPIDIMHLKTQYYVQRCLSLSRTGYLAGEFEMCSDYFLKALRQDWRVIGKWSYLRKYIRSKLGQ